MMRVLSDNQIKKLSDIASDIGMIVLASVGLPAIFEKGDLLLMSGGITVAIFFWIISLSFLKSLNS